MDIACSEGYDERRQKVEYNRKLHRRISKRRGIQGDKLAPLLPSEEKRLAPFFGGKN